MAARHAASASWSVLKICPVRWKAIDLLNFLSRVLEGLTYCFSRNSLLTKAVFQSMARKKNCSAIRVLSIVAPRPIRMYSENLVVAGPYETNLSNTIVLGGNFSIGRQSRVFEKPSIEKSITLDHITS